MVQRPTALSVVCVLAIVIACFGILSIISSIAAATGNARGLDRMFNMPGQNREMVQIQQQLQQEMAAAGKPWRAYQILLDILLAIVCAGLIAGGVKTFRLRKPGIALLTASMLVAIPVEVARGTVNVLVSRNMSDVTARFTERVMRLGTAGQPAPPPGTGGLPWIMQFGFYMAAAAIVAWAIFKVCFFVGSMIYLRKPVVRTLFARPPAQTPRPVPPPLPPRGNKLSSNREA